MHYSDLDDDSSQKGRATAAMAYLVELTEPRSVGIRAYDDPSPAPGEVLVRTWYSGISAGTELATYRGTNPYLDRRWDPEMALFLGGGTTFSYPRRRLGLLRGRCGRGGRTTT